MKTVRFTYPHPSGGYGCNTPGDCSGEYVPAAVARELLAALKRATPWLGRLIVEGVHLKCVAPNDAERTLDHAEAAIRAAEAEDQPPAWLGANLKEDPPELCEAMKMAAKAEEHHRRSAG